jgi:hypothetical protein
LIWLIWLSRFCPHEGKKRVKGIETSMVLSVFVPYCRKKKNAFRHSLSFHRKYIGLIGYIGGQKSTSSGVPIHASAGVLPLAMQALLVTLIELFLNYKPSAGRGEPGTWVARQTGKSKQIDKKIDRGHSSGVAAARHIEMSSPQP